MRITQSGYGNSYFNTGKFLFEAIGSLPNQSFTNFELMVTDQSITQSSLRIVRNFKDRRQKIFQCAMNRTIDFSRNNGLEPKDAKHSSFDVEMPYTFQEPAEIMNKNIGFEMVGNNVILVFGHGQMHRNAPNHWLRYNRKVVAGREFHLYPSLQKQPTRTRFL